MIAPSVLRTLGSVTEAFEATGDPASQRVLHSRFHIEHCSGDVLPPARAQERRQSHVAFF
jgi:hypothetical protein